MFRNYQIKLLVLFLILWGLFQFAKTDAKSIQKQQLELNAASMTISPAALLLAPIATDGLYTIAEDNPVSGNAITEDTGFGIDFDGDGDLLTASLVMGPLTGTLILTDDGSFNYTPAMNWSGYVTFTYLLTDGTFLTLTTPLGDFGDDPFDSFSLGRSKSIDLGDLDGDGDLDAVVGNYGDEAQEVWLNQGGIQGGTPGDFEASSYLPFGKGWTNAVALGDVDRDGDLDVVLANEFNKPEEVWLNQGGLQGGTLGHFGITATALITTGNTNDVALGDLDGDGDLDMVLANGGGEIQQVWFNQGGAQGGVEGQFGTVAFDTFGGNNTTAIALGDLDGDGDLDIVLAQNSNQNQEVWMNQGGIQAGTPGRFGPNWFDKFGGGFTRDVALGDLDGDGDLDALLANYANQAQEVWLNQGGAQGGTAGNFGAVPYQSFGSGGTFEVVLGDLDGDGDLDAALAQDFGDPQEIWLNDGSGNFGSTAYDIFGANHTYDINLGDLDGDGDLDIILSQYFEPQEVWLNQNAMGWQMSNTAVVTITVTAENDPPLALDDWYSATMGITLTVPANGILNNDNDIDTAMLTATLLVDVFTGTLTLNNDGSFSYVPPLGYSGIVTYTYSCSDGTLTDWATVTISISACFVPLTDVSPITISGLITDVNLSWLGTGDASSYEIWYNDAPYFTPAGDCTTPAGGLSCALASSANWTHTNGYGNATTNSYYKIYGTNGCGIDLGGGIQHIGEFDFVIVPGL